MAYKIKEFKQTKKYIVYYCDTKKQTKLITYQEQEFDKSIKVDCVFCDLNHVMEVIGWEETIWKE
jgi:hypothetical protein